jgi:peptidoglycan/xylan/chitin deacetylase (PgdA/CDA1 family)
LSYNNFQQPILNLAAKTFWRMPGPFGFARLLGPSYSLRCVVFHNISAAETPFTTGISVSTTPKKFEAALEFLTTYYTPVCMEDVLAGFDGRALPSRAVLVTFDDAYASVVEIAAPLCRKFGVPAVFFVNAAFLDNKRLAPDNLVCYVANMNGMGTINAAARSVRGSASPELGSLSDVFTGFFPSLSLAERDIFLKSLEQSGGVSKSGLARDAGLYLTTEQLRSLASFNFEIGNHTYTHVHCRALSKEDLRQEVDRNKEELEDLTGRKVRAFSQPYGSSKDLTPELACYLRQTGHEAAFLSESATNSRKTDAFHLDRVNSRVDSDDSFFLEIEVLPRLRTVRNQLFRNSRIPLEN